MRTHDAVRHMKEEERKMARKSKDNDSKLSKLTPVAQELISEVRRTRNTRALALMVRAAIAQRDRLLGKVEVEEDIPESAFERFTESKPRSRTQRLCKAIKELDDRKDVAALCAAAITQRRLARAAANR